MIQLSFFKIYCTIMYTINRNVLISEVKEVHFQMHTVNITNSKSVELFFLGALKSVANILVTQEDKH